MGTGRRIPSRFVDQIPLTGSGNHPCVVNTWSAPVPPSASLRTGAAGPIPARASLAGAPREAAAQAE